MKGIARVFLVNACSFFAANFINTFKGKYNKPVPLLFDVQINYESLLEHH